MTVRLYSGEELRLSSPRGFVLTDQQRLIPDSNGFGRDSAFLIEIHRAPRDSEEPRSI